MAHWFYNSHSGAVEEHGDWSLFQVQVHLGVGWHGPFNTQQDAINYYDQYKGANPGWAAPRQTIPTTLGSGPAQPVIAAGNAAVDAGGKAIATVGTAANNVLFGGINIQSWLIRIGEILLGLVLVGVSIAKMTGTSNVISKALKVGALA